MNFSQFGFEDLICSTTRRNSPWVEATTVFRFSILRLSRSVSGLASSVRSCEEAALSFVSKPAARSNKPCIVLSPLFMLESRSDSCSFFDLARFR